MSIAEDTTQTEEVFLLKKRSQYTICNKVSISGKGLFSGSEVTMTLLPAEENTGIVFQRVDLPLSPKIKATSENVLSTNRTTVIGKNSATVTCVEHLLSVFYAYNIDNVLVQLDAGEPPVMDGSGKDFTTLVESAGKEDQEAKKNQYALHKPQYMQSEDTTIIALPSSSLKFSYTLSYKDQPLLESQYMHFDFESLDYKSEIAPCRTFALAEEVKFLVAANFIKNMSEDYGLVIDGETLLYEKSLHYPNEMARHKILDMMGDFALGEEVIAHFIAVKSGHAMNVAFTKLLRKLIKEL